MSDHALQRIESPPTLEIDRPATAILDVIARAAKDPNVDVDKMERLMAMQERILAKQAEAEFNLAMQAAQAEMPIVGKDATNASTNSRFTKLETLYKAVVPIITKHGFSVSFGTADCPIQGHFRITARVTHGAHSEKYQADIPSDHLGSKGNPNKTLTHGFGSAMSYGRRYLTLLIFNVATGEDNDGNVGGKEGPEVILGLKSMVWSLLRKHGKVQSGGTWDHGRQWLIDEAVLDPDLPIADLDSKGWRAVLATATKKLEAK